jgi:hypothetical protein
MGWWATDALGELQLVARSGELFEVRPGDFRTISSMTTADFNDGARNQYDFFNNAGQFVFGMTFTDGSSGVFVAHVPEPSSFVLTVFGGILAVRRRGRIRKP